MDETAMPGGNSDADCTLLYKCLKKLDDPLLLGKVCKWSGIVFDYVPHLKERHPENCFRVTGGKTFCWQIPKVGAQEDKGILQYKTVSYLYTVVYASDLGELQFSLVSLDGVARKYSFCLRYGSDKHCVEECTSSDVRDLFLPVRERANAIVIPRRVLDNYFDNHKRLKWRINFV